VLAFVSDNLADTSAYATSRPSTPSFAWWRLFAVRLGGGPLPSIDVADVLLDERRELTERVRN
jgi:hypothetical protein